MLGGGKWVPSADNLNEQDRAVFLGDAWHNPREIRFTLTLVTTALLPNTYPADRESVADSVVAMRDEQRLQYKDIANILCQQGVSGARGAHLEAENIFALYKKRKAYLAKRTASTRLAITNMIVYPAKTKRSDSSNPAP